MTMNVINVNDAKAHLSAYLERVERGETIVICRRNQPVAELRPVRGAQRTRSVAPAGTFEVADSFDAPLPAAVLAAFSGQDRELSPESVSRPERTTRVAERSPVFGGRPSRKPRTRR
jgi:prevent-host-death family protein